VEHVQLKAVLRQRETGDLMDVHEPAHKNILFTHNKFVMFRLIC